MQKPYNEQYGCAGSSEAVAAVKVQGGNELPKPVQLKHNNPPSFGPANFQNNFASLNHRSIAAGTKGNNPSIITSNQSSFKSFGMIVNATNKTEKEEDYAVGLQQITQTKPMKLVQGRRGKFLLTLSSLVLPSKESNEQFNESVEQIVDSSRCQQDDDQIMSGSMDFESQNSFEFISGSDAHNTKVNVKKSQVTLDIIFSKLTSMITSCTPKEEEKEGQIQIKSQTIDVRVDGGFRLGPVLEQLEKLGLELKDSSVWFFSDWSKNYMHVGQYPSRQAREYIVPHSMIDLDAGRLIIKTCPTTPERKNSRTLEDLLTPTTQHATSTESPCQYHKSSKPWLRHAMTADFNYNFSDEKNNRSVQATNGKKNASQLNLFLPQILTSLKSISANHGILSPVLSPRAQINSVGEKKDQIVGYSKVVGHLEHTVRQTMQLSTEQPREIYKEPALRCVMKAEQQQSLSQLKSTTACDTNKQQSSLASSTNIQFKRVKERTIKEVIRKVCVWRKLYNGILRADGTLVRYSLENAARKSQMSKKSLDDYLHQIRLGRKYKFDFKNRQDEKFGTLRTYIRKLRSNEATEKGKIAESMELDLEK